MSVRLNILFLLNGHSQRPVFANISKQITSLIPCSVAYEVRTDQGEEIYKLVRIPYGFAFGILFTKQDAAHHSSSLNTYLFLIAFYSDYLFGYCQIALSGLTAPYFSFSSCTSETSNIPKKINFDRCGNSQKNYYVCSFVR